MRGHAAYLARDFAAAISAYREAVQEEPQNPAGHYFLGEAQLASGNLGEADASWANGVRLAGTDESTAAKLLFVIADLRDRQGRPADAKRAWDEYASFAAAHPGATAFPDVARERARLAVSRREALDRSTPVRERITAREKELSAPPPDTMPQGAKGAPAPTRAPAAPASVAPARPASVPVPAPPPKRPALPF